MPPSPSALTAVVGIGASAGGLEPLETLFTSMPRQTGCAFIVIQHLSPDFKSLMDDLLARHTDIPIIKAEDQTTLRPDHIYLPPPGTRVSIQDNRLHLEPGNKEPTGSTRIDHFLSSLAGQWQDKAIGVILSGSGSDGTKGATAIKEAGGCVICQDPSSAQFDSMPRSVLRTGKVDFTCATEAIPDTLLSFLRPATNADDSKTSPAEEDSNAQPVEWDDLQPVFAALQERFGIPFSEYKQSTVQRRIQRRIGLRHGMAREHYLKDIITNPEELDALYHDLLIGVTSFFRDPKAFEALRQPLTAILRDKEPHEEFRAWVAGCATGQEAYSLAFLINDVAQQEGFSGKIILYATDAHRRSLATASSAFYSREEIQSIPEPYRSQYLLPQNSRQFQITDKIRRQVIFAPHDLLNDPPFTRMDLISCRNVLIYLQPTAQARLLKSVNYALRKDGLFFLGASEELSQMADYFQLTDKSAKLFRKIRQVHGLPSFTGSRTLTRHEEKPLPPKTDAATLIGKRLLNAYDTLLQRHIPEGLLLSTSGEILHFFGDAEKYLVTLSGRPSLDIFGRTTGQLRIAVRSLLDRITKGEPYLEYANVPREDETSPLLDLTAASIPDPAGGELLVHLQFREHKASPRPAEPESTAHAIPFQSDKESNRRIQELESQLTSTRANLQATVEELQTTNEELQASNEEMLSSNEELQSTNEELQSVNEELYSVNSEYSAKNDELSNLNVEHDALLQSLSIGIIFIDHELRIRRFNQAVTDIVNLLPQDIGRPLDHLASLLNDENNLLEHARAVLADGKDRQCLVQTRNGQTYLQRTVPFQQEPGSRNGVVLSFADLTEIQKTRDELHRSEERLNLAIESAQQGIWEANPITGEALFGDSFYRLLGYQPGDFPASMDQFRELLHPADRQRRWQRLLVKMEKKEPFSLEFRVRHHDGNWFWASCSGQARQSAESGQSNRVIGLLTDINDRKRMEFMVRENERKLELSLQSAGQIWWEWEIPNHILRTHGVGDCILGYACHEVDKSEDFWWNRIPEEEIPAVKETLRQHFDGEKKFWYSEHRYRNTEGRFRWVREMGQIIERDKENNPVRMIGITQYDHDRKQNEIDLKRNREFYSSIVEDQSDLICRYTPDFHLTFANKAFSDFFPHSTEELQDASWLRLLPAEQRQPTRECIGQITTEQPLITHQLTFNMEGDSPRYFQWTHRAFFTESGAVREYQSVGRDVTVLKEQEASLRQSLAEANEARQRAELANKAKSDFLAAINHELRTPLNPIIVGSELLQESADSTSRELASMIHSAGNHLLHLINSVLDLSKLEADKLQPYMAPFNTAVFIRELGEIFRHSAEEKGLNYTCSTLPGLPPTVITDSSLLRQIVLNLISNAVKFTASGSISIEADFQPAGQPETGQLRITVADTGIGIPDNLLESIFDPFIQGDSGVSRKFGGTGIGLTISRRIAQLLGGDIIVSSSEEKGSRFQLTIPVSLPENQSNKGEDPANQLDGPETQLGLASLRILVVDDDATNRQILEASLRKRVHLVATAEDGVEAIHRVRKEPFHIVIMDIHMPNLDGFETTRSIMDDPEILPKPAFLFLSADTRKEMENKALGHKSAGFLRKPVTPSKLLAAVAAIADNNKS